MNMFVVICLRAALFLLSLAIKGINKMSVELDNANAAAATLQVAVAAVGVKISELKAAQPAGVDPAAVQGIADRINADVASLNAALL
jgi:hypothetical protein